MKRSSQLVRIRAVAGAALGLFTLLWPECSWAQTITYVYVAPKAAMTGLAAPADTGFFDVGYGHVLVTAANEAKFKAAAPANLGRTYDDLKPGTPLRKRLDEILKINGGLTDLTVALVDDRTGITRTSRFATMARGDGVLYAWPAASVWPAVGGHRYRGFIGLGAVAADSIGLKWPGQWKAWESTMTHECFHTQFVNEKTKWGAVNIVYGGDNQHWFSELLGEQELTFEEGFGTFFGLIDNPDWWQKSLLPFFRNADPRYDLESRSVLAGTSEMWNAPHTEEVSPPPDSVGSYSVRTYKWKDVPGYYILFNEYTSTAFHYLFYSNANGNRDSSYAMIRRSAGAMSQDRRKRYLTYDVNRLALQLEDFAATPNGAASKSAGTLTSSLFPFALLDVLTHFGMSDAEYRRSYDINYPDRNPKAYDLYWARRDGFKTMVQADLDADPIRIEEAVQKISDYCHRPEMIVGTGPAPGDAPR